MQAISAQSLFMVLTEASEACVLILISKSH